MNTVKGLCAAAAIGAFCWVGSAAAGSIQPPGLTTGLPEGFAPTEGLFAATPMSFGGYNTPAGNVTSAMAIPTFLTWSTPWEPFGARLEVKTAPLVYADIRMPGAHAASLYSPYGGLWLSWYVGGGFNFAIGDGAWFGYDSPVDKLTGRNYVAFQQNVALSYVKNNLDLTANAFYAAGRTDPTASQPDTFNVDLTATKRDGRLEYGFVGAGEWDLNQPKVGYGKPQAEFDAGLLVGYILGNQIQGQLKLTHAVFEQNIGGHNTSVTGQLIIPIWSPPAPPPRNAN
jgi:hypothetical protein